MNEVIVTYSWDSEVHKTKALSFTDFLRKKGFKADIDRKKSQEQTATDFTQMMHQAITDYRKIIIILSKGYKNKADNFKGGVGTEYRLIINDIDENPKKYILVTFDDLTNEIVPANFKGREVIQIKSEKDFNLLFAKLKDEEIIEFSAVSISKPEVQKESIPDFSDLIRKDEPIIDHAAKTSFTIDRTIINSEGKSYEGRNPTLGKRYLFWFHITNIGKIVEREFKFEIKIPHEIDGGQEVTLAGGTKCLNNYEVSRDHNFKRFVIGVTETIFPHENFQVGYLNIGLKKGKSNNDILKKKVYLTLYFSGGNIEKCLTIQEIFENHYSSIEQNTK